VAYPDDDDLYDDEDDERPVARTLPPPAPEGFAPPARGQRVIAVGGGRGGVGKSLLTVNLGVYFAQLGRDVVVVDADPFGSNLHAVLGLEAPPLVLHEGEDPTAPPVATTVPGLSLLPAALDPMTATPVRASRGAHLLREVRKLDADYVILHLGASTHSASLDAFLQSDVSIAVSAPEPQAVEATYRFVRALYARNLRRALMKERYKLRLVERALHALPPLASPWQLIAEIKRFDDAVAKVAAQELGRFLPRLVLGQTRLKSDLELGPAMAAISERFLGIPLDYLGHVEHDDAVWLTTRRRQPLLIDSPTSKSARNLERVARRILALLAAPPPRQAETMAAALVRAARAGEPLNLYEALGVSRTSADDEIRRAYKRQREIFRAGSLPVVSVVAPDALRREEARIEEAHDTLLDPVRRRAYDLSVFPDQPPTSIAPARTLAASAAELEMLQAELAREINAETQFSGALLRKVRESQGIEIADIAARLKISGGHLAAIEAEDPTQLPAHVYVSGFVQQVAKLLKLDPAQVAKTYMRRLREASPPSPPSSRMAPPLVRPRGSD
jgi:flagellar biosynthesis protein FlhG